MNYIQDNIRLTKENILLRRRLERANRLLEGWLGQLPHKVTTTIRVSSRHWCNPKSES